MSGVQKVVIGIGAAICLALAMLAGWGLGAPRGTSSAEALVNLGPGRYG